jgi:mannitol/fructose-specific phosphotransferase system IIA component (Ntr-type)
MALDNLLSAEQIIPEMKATERWPAIVELIDLLVGLDKIKTADRDSILASLKQREETMSTGIGFGIAIPHCSSDRLEEVVAAFGRSTSGIEFDALDNAPVKFVVLFIVPKNQFQTHLRTLASIAKFLNDRATRERLGEAKSAGEILSIFRDRSQKVYPPKAFGAISLRTAKRLQSVAKNSWRFSKHFSQKDFPMHWPRPSCRMRGN